MATPISMGTAWASALSYPWEQGLYVGGIETAKVNLTLRIYSNAWHVYAGLAILNPSAKIQIDQYAKSSTELFKLMLSGGSSAKEGKKFRERVEWSRDVVFGGGDTSKDGGKRKGRKPILLSQEVLDRFSLGITTAELSPTSKEFPSAVSPPSKYRPNRLSPLPPGNG